MPRASFPNVFNMGAHLNHLSPSACEACCLAQVSFAVGTTKLGEIVLKLDRCFAAGSQAESSSPEWTGRPLSTFASCVNKACLCGLKSEKVQNILIVTLPGI